MDLRVVFWYNIFVSHSICIRCFDIGILNLMLMNLYDAAMVFYGYDTLLPISVDIGDYDDMDVL